MSLDCLVGIRVLDLSQYLPGPYATQILSDLGAEVVKVEPPGGEPMRRLGPRDADGISAFYKLINAGKTVVELDLKAAPGRAALEDLVRRADVLLDSFRPGVMDRLGFGAAALRALNPRLIHCALSGFGQGGPYAHKGGHDITYMALAGGLATSGPAERPAVAHPPVADFAGAMQAALTVLGALVRRARSGQGATIDVSLAETVLGWQGVVLTGARRPGYAPERAAALLNGGAACYQIYQTADGRFVALGALEAKFWANFCRAAARADWIARQDEPLPQTDLIGEVAAFIAGAPLDAWIGRFAGVDCCFQPVLEPAEAARDPHVQARGLVRETGGPDSDREGPRVEVLFPAFFDGQAPAPRPALREATADDIVARWAVEQ